LNTIGVSFSDFNWARRLESLKAGKFPGGYSDYKASAWRIHPNVAKAGGLQSQGVKGEVVVVYLESLTTQDLKSSGFPEG